MNNIVDLFSVAVAGKKALNNEFRPMTIDLGLAPRLWSSYVRPPDEGALPIF